MWQARTTPGCRHRPCGYGFRTGPLWRGRSSSPARRPYRRGSGASSARRSVRSVYRRARRGWSPRGRPSCAAPIRSGHRPEKTAPCPEKVRTAKPSRTSEGKTPVPKQTTEAPVVRLRETNGPLPGAWPGSFRPGWRDPGSRIRAQNRRLVLSPCFPPQARRGRQQRMQTPHSDWSSRLRVGRQAVCWQCGLAAGSLAGDRGRHRRMDGLASVAAASATRRTVDRLRLL